MSTIRRKLFANLPSNYNNSFEIQDGASINKTTHILVFE